MRPILLLILSCLSVHALAQISYPAGNYAAVGDSFHVSTATAGLGGFNFAAAGANQTWNFANLPFDDQDDIKFVNPANGGYQFWWCLSNAIIFGCNSQFATFTNLAEAETGSVSFGGISFDNVLLHQNRSSTQLQSKMLGITAQVAGVPLPLVFEYEDVDTIYQFPLTFGQVDSSNGRLVLDLSGTGNTLTLIQDRKRVNTVEGWGSLTTPFGNFPSTLKMKTILTIRDTSIVGGVPVPTPRTEVQYRWFDLNYGIPVLEATGTLALGIELITNVTYIDSFRCVEPGAFYIYTPLIPTYDSASQSAIVNFTNLSSSADSLMWDFGDGTTSAAPNPSHTYACPGLKLVELRVYNTLCTPTVGDTISLPIFINDTSLLFVPDTMSVSLCQGDSLLVGGAWQKTAGLYLDRFTNQNGCDSIVAVAVGIVQPTQGAETYVGCMGDAYQVVVNSTTYNEANPTGTETLVNAQGCDSVVSINLVFNANSQGAESYIGCAGDGYQITVNGTTYDEANPTGTETLTNAQGCDSIVNINLVYNASSQGSETYTGCEGDGYQVVVNGTTYSEANPTGMETLTNAQGCDSLVSIALTYNAANGNTINYAGCSGDGFSTIVNGTTYDELNPIGIETLSNAEGCDSIVNIELRFDTVDLTISPFGILNRLQVLQTNATYQWLNCTNGFAVIVGETNSIYDRIFDIDEYACEITVGGCVDTTDCAIAILESIAPAAGTFQIFPNPFDQEITLIGKHPVDQIKIYSITGQLVWQKAIPLMTQFTISPDLPNGMYTLLIQTQQRLYVHRMQRD